MKIRHKQSGVVLEGAFDERAYWVGSTRHEYFGLVPESSTYDKKEWEEVKPGWKDVTAECEGIANDGLGDQFAIRRNGEVVVYANPRSPYRLLKVRHEELNSGWAFIIEQRHT